MSLLPIILILAGCSFLTRTETVTETVYVDRDIPVKQHPNGLNLRDVTWYVVTEENFEEFKTEFMRGRSEFVFFAISVEDYERMSLNLADLTRYIKQQKELIVYYEKAIQNEE